MKKVLSIAIDGELADRIERYRREVAAKPPHLIITRSSVISEAIKEYLRRYVRGGGI